MSLSVEQVTDIPKREYSKRQHHSKSQKVVEAALASGTGIVRVRATDAIELAKFYKALIQWTARHPEYKVAVKKDADSVYVSKASDVEGHGAQWIALDFDRNRVTVPKNRVPSDVAERSQRMAVPSG